MRIKLKYEFTKEEIRALNYLLHSLLVDFKLDMLTAEKQLEELVLFDFYKNNLSLFMFPEDYEIVELTASESIAFLKVFKKFDDDSFESMIIQKICMDIITILTDGVPYSQSNYINKIEG
jgi:predicted secreted protein